MNCQDYKNQILDWVLGELPAGSGRALEEHAANCAVCGRELSRLKRAQLLLKQSWRDEDIPTSIVFVPPTPTRPGAWQWLFGAPRWVNVSMATVSAVAVLFMALSLARVRVQYGQGSFAMSFGPSSVAPINSSSGGAALTNAAYNPAELQKLVAAQYASLNAQDRERYAAMLEQLSQQVQAQRQADLQRIGMAFDQVKTVVWKDLQRNSALVQYAAQQISSTAKN